MKEVTLGILGLGVRSTLYYLKELNRLYNQEKGGYNTCPYLLLNANFEAINSLLPNTSPQLDAIAQQHIIDIERMGIEHILIPNITLQETIDRIVVKKKIIHPVHLSISKIKDNKWPKVVLFGSIHSMQAAYISAQFTSSNIEVMLPGAADMLLIDEMRKRVYFETETEELIKDYYLLIQKYKEQYPVVLACTELSILKPKNIDNLLDMADIQIAEAVSTIL